MAPVGLSHVRDILDHLTALKAARLAMRLILPTPNVISPPQIRLSSRKIGAFGDDEGRRGIYPDFSYKRTWYANSTLRLVYTDSISNLIYMTSLDTLARDLPFAHLFSPVCLVCALYAMFRNQSNSPYRVIPAPGTGGSDRVTFNDCRSAFYSCVGHHCQSVFEWIRNGSGRRSSRYSSSV